MGNTFRHINVLLAGDFGPKGDKIKQWVEVNGGTFSKEMNEDVTHVISTQNAFRKRVTAVREAKGRKGVKIVSLEWLEDSLLSKRGRPIREGPYLFKQGSKSAGKKARLEAKKKTDAKKVKAQEERPPAKVSETDGYKIHKDQSGVSYYAQLTRPIQDSKSREKHVLEIIESNAGTPTYATVVKYSRVGRSAVEFLAPAGSTWETAFAAFDKFFKAKSGRSWDQRASNPPPKKSREGEVLPVHENWFDYKPEGLPSRGKEKVHDKE